MKDNVYDNSPQPMAAIANELHAMNQSRVKGLAQLATISEQLDRLFRTLANIQAGRIDQGARILRIESHLWH